MAHLDSKMAAVDTDESKSSSKSHDLERNKSAVEGQVLDELTFQEEDLVE